MQTYSLINYFDVWGNADDGYEVNNLCVEFDDLCITPEMSNNDIIDYLVAVGFLSSNDHNDYFVDSIDGDFIEIFAIDDMYPLCRLQANLQ